MVRSQHKGFGSQVVVRHENLVEIMGKIGSAFVEKTAGLNYDFFVVLTHKVVAEPRKVVVHEFLQISSTCLRNYGYHVRKIRS